jgi:hypothetical protein
MCLKYSAASAVRQNRFYRCHEQSFAPIPVLTTQVAGSEIMRGLRVSDDDRNVRMKDLIFHACTASTASDSRCSDYVTPPATLLTADTNASHNTRRTRMVALFARVPEPIMNDVTRPVFGL